MTFGEWYLRRGRISRRTYWLHYTLPLAALGLLAGLADGAFGYPGLMPTAPADGLVELFGGPLSLAVFAFTIAPSISSTVTRLHDRSHSAWWLLWALVPLVGAVVLVVQVGGLRGDGGPNRYGPPEGRPAEPQPTGLDTWA
jgi:uncharacterized membrane protein YhaH (DUF805 family)